MGGIRQDIIKALRDFADKLENGESIEITEVRREETPDGPMHVFTKKRWIGGSSCDGSSQ